MGISSGNTFIDREMSSASARFKYAFRQCRLDELTISSTKLADSMDTHDVDSFWKDIRERNKSKSTMSNFIEGIRSTGEADDCSVLERSLRKFTKQLTEH